MDNARNLAGIDVISSPYLPPYMALLRSGSQMVVIDMRSEEQKARDEEAREPKPWFWCLHYTKSKKARRMFEPNVPTSKMVDMVSEARRARASEATLREENDCLRAIASKIMPCHYCGLDDVSKCRSGFPGCALMDDRLGGDECANEVVRELRAENERLAAENHSLRGGIHDECPDPYQKIRVLEARLSAFESVHRETEPLAAPETRGEEMR